MDLSTCKYHPLSTANFFCELCELDFCDTCADESPIIDNPDAGHKCVLCKSSLTELDHTSEVKPFWHDLKSVYLYPLSKAGAATLTILALLSSIAPFSFALPFFSTVLLIHYASTCLNKTANGVMTPPVLERIFTAEVSSLIHIIFLIILISIFVGASNMLFGYAFSIVVMLFFTIAFPASIMVIAIDKKLINALNPAKLSAIMKTTGMSYLLMWFFSLVMFSSLSIMSGILLSSNPSFINFFITSLVSGYYTIVIFHLMGYIVFQHSKKLHFSINDAKAEHVIRTPQKRQKDHCETLIKAGEFSKATNHALELLESPDATLWEWKRCFQLSLTNTDDKKISAFLHRYFDKLNDSNQTDLIAESYIKTLKRLPSYQPKNDTIWLSVAKSLFDIGHYKATASMLSRFPKYHKDSHHLVDVYQMLSESFAKISGYEKQAKQYANLASVLKA